MRTVARISVTPVKGFRLAHPEAIELTEHGATGDRLFSLVWADGRIRSSLNAWHNTVEARYDGGLLTMRFEDGSIVQGDGAALGEQLTIDFGERRVPVWVVDGPWTEPLGRLAGRPVRLVRGTHAANVGKLAPVSLVSDGSLGRFEREAGRSLDSRRFRMLFELAGCEEHEEDGWRGRRVQIGEAVVRVEQPVVRCAVTTRDPATGEKDFDTLSLLGRYRGEVVFGMLADVERPGRVQVGDAVAVLD